MHLLDQVAGAMVPIALVAHKERRATRVAIGSLDELTLARYQHHTLPVPAGDGIAFIGDSAHSTSPQLGQGANIALIDGVELADRVVADRAPMVQVLERYQSARRADVASRLIAIDVANRSLLSDFLGMQSLRAAGMHLLGSFGPLRRLAMREGLAPTWKRVS